MTKWFDRWARKAGVSDRSLCDAIDEMSRGLIGGKLGKTLYKKRVAAPGRGKRGAYRTLVAFKSGDRSFFLYGFAKNEKDDIKKDEERALKALAGELLGYDVHGIARALTAKELRELRCGDE